MVQPTRDETLSAWEAFAIAKHYPGRIEVPYVGAMNISPNPTKTFSVNYSMS